MSVLGYAKNSMGRAVPPASTVGPGFCPVVLGTRGRTLKACLKEEERGIGRRVAASSIHE
jgi:hypothetical protein